MSKIMDLIKLIKANSDEKVVWHYIAELEIEYEKEADFDDEND
ncbi:MAG: hypothetical protein ACRCZZ_08855 [Phocaeicola sp.]